MDVAGLLMSEGITTFASVLNMGFVTSGALSWVDYMEYLKRFSFLMAWPEVDSRP